MSIFSGWYGKIATAIERALQRQVLCRLGAHKWIETLGGRVCAYCGEQEDKE